MSEREFLEFITGVKDKMYRLSLRILISKDAAHDATQEVILKLWKIKAKLKEYHSPEAFAMTMTKNYSYDQLKAKRNNQVRLVHTNYEDNQQSSLQRQIEAKDELKQVQKIISNLSEQEQLLIQLRDVEQYSYDEMEKISGLKPTAMRVCLSRARKKIRTAMLKQHEYGVTK